MEEEVGEEVVDAGGVEMTDSDPTALYAAFASSSSEGDDLDDVEEQVWLPGMEGEGGGNMQLDFDRSAYHMMHKLRTEWPCLSVDVVPDTLGQQRALFPHTMYLAAGSQAGAANANRLYLMKVTRLTRMQADDSSDEEDDDKDTTADPILQLYAIPHKGGTNRIRVMPQKPSVVATWAETGKVHVWKLTKQLRSLEQDRVTDSGKQVTPAFTFHGHSTEGFSMDWSPLQAGRLITGDCANQIFAWSPEASGWSVDTVPFSDHTDSVEDLQWSPTEANVFASCSADKSIRIWDTRSKSKSALSVANAHRSDVNVISWNAVISYLLASGGDDGRLKVWDLRKFAAGEAGWDFAWHSKPITSVQWSPGDDSVFCAGCADDTVSVWDLSAEAEADEPQMMNDKDVPPQLMFLHMGQKSVKEVRWHAQIPGAIVSTAADGFDLWKAFNVGLHETIGTQAAAEAAKPDAMQVKE